MLHGNSLPTPAETKKEQLGPTTLNMNGLFALPSPSSLSRQIPQKPEEEGAQKAVSGFPLTHSPPKWRQRSEAQKISFSSCVAVPPSLLPSPCATIRIFGSFVVEWYGMCHEDLTGVHTTYIVTRGPSPTSIGGFEGLRSGIVLLFWAHERTKELGRQTR